VAGLIAQAATESAYYTIKINLPNILDTAFKTNIKRQANSLKIKSVKLGNELRLVIEKELKKI